jgi:NitT/TauT family transport system ATP-binding protein
MPPLHTQTQTAISFNDLSFSFTTESGKQLHVLDQLSFSVGLGERIALVGPSGCGKSTLLRIALGLIAPPDATAVTIHPSLQEHVGFVAQEPLLYEWRTVLQNGVLGLEGQGRLDSFAVRYVRDLLSRFGLKDFLFSLPGPLSGGMK